MRELGFQMKFQSSAKFIFFPCLISSIFVIISQFTLSLVPHYFPSSPLLLQLYFSVLLLLVITGIGKLCRSVLGIYASAPALVFMNILFIWGVHILVIRKVVPLSMDIMLNVEFALLLFGFLSIFYSDPGRVVYGDSSSDQAGPTEDLEVSYSEEEKHLMIGVFPDKADIIVENSCGTRRIRYCKSCKAYTRGYDHHCPAFGNCIGENNHLLFLALLVGFVMVEASYIVCSNQYISKTKIVDEPILETHLSDDLVISSMLFSLLQVAWQVFFLIWHIYCACVNIRTDEWINWRKYPEFKLVHPQAGQSFSEITFVNPYDKGVLCNLKELLSLK